MNLTINGFLTTNGVETTQKLIQNATRFKSRFDDKTKNSAGGKSIVLKFVFENRNSMEIGVLVCRK